MAHKLSRRNVLSASAAAAGLALPISASATNAAKPTVLIEQTLLKAKPGLREDLIRYIELNWFELDELATRVDLFTGYWMTENKTPGAEWDVAVCVGYPQAEGYNHPETKAAFDKLRGNRKPVLINRKNLTELGGIVGNQSLTLRSGRASISKA